MKNNLKKIIETFYLCILFALFTLMISFILQMIAFNMSNSFNVLNKSLFTDVIIFLISFSVPLFLFKSTGTVLNRNLIIIFLSVGLIFFLGFQNKFFIYSIDKLIGEDLPVESNEYKQLSKIKKEGLVKDYVQNIQNFRSFDKYKFFIFEDNIKRSNLKNKDIYINNLSEFSKEEFFSLKEFNLLEDSFCKDVVEDFVNENKDILIKKIGDDLNKNSLNNCKVADLIIKIESKNFKGLDVMNMNYYDIDLIMKNYLK